MIEISHLTKRYGDHVAVSDLSLDIAPGRIYGFLGPNGAGKSTTMNIITGYTAATEGTVKINGYDILKQPEEAKRCIGYLPEMPPLYTEMTTGEYLKFAADLKKLPKAKKYQYMEEAMELTGITDVRNRLIRNLSKGYRQRVGFAQAVLGFPEIIILDEPAVGLDPKQIIEIRELIHSLGRRHTVILSSHILTEVKEVCEHIFIISSGRLVASDTTQNLVNRMSGERKLRLLLKGTEEAAADALRHAGLADFTLEQGMEEGCCVAEIKTEAEEDIRERVFYACSGADLPILDMHTGGRSLEEIFLELTEQGAGHMTGEQQTLASGHEDGEPLMPSVTEAEDREEESDAGSF